MVNKDIFVMGMFHTEQLIAKEPMTEESKISRLVKKMLIKDVFVIGKLYTDITPTW